jgi:hypothetical protein
MVTDFCNVVQVDIHIPEPVVEFASRQGVTLGEELTKTITIENNGALEVRHFTLSPLTSPITKPKCGSENVWSVLVFIAYECVAPSRFAGTLRVGDDKSAYLFLL